PASQPGSAHMITVLAAMKETTVMLEEVAAECEHLQHRFLADRLRQQARHNRAVVVRMENAALIIRIEKDHTKPVLSRVAE
ncbi:MAG: hypothetical protein ACREJU_02570, partial [Nitrospiraceae bacterium]